MSDSNLDFSEFESVDKQSWLNKIKKAASEEELKALFTEKPDGFTLSAYYDYSDLEHLDFKESVPGHFPYVNGFSVSSFPKLRSRIGIEKFMKAAGLIKEATAHGVNEIALVSDHFGNDNELAHLLSAVDFNKVSLHVDFGESNAAFAFVLADELNQRNIAADSVKGSIGNDFLGELAFKGNYNHSLNESVSILKSLIEFGKESLPKMKMVHVDGSAFHEAGATAGMELGFVLAKLTEYAHILSDKGVSVADLVNTLEITLSVNAEDYFTSIAKLRAFRVLWATWAESFELGDVFPHIHVITAQRNKTSFDEYNNLLRLTAEGMAALAGGCDSLTIQAHDGTFKNSRSGSLRLASNVYHLLKHESKMTQVTDPAAGSYYIENLTDKLIDSAWKWFTECERKGGYIESLNQKFIQGVIEEQSTRDRKLFTESKKVLVGVNKFPYKDDRLSGKTELAPIPVVLNEELKVMPIKKWRLAEKLEDAKIKSETENMRNEMESTAKDDLQ
ncbi:MAG: methylmalonyl-CoA mutase family protein [Flavobacteriales bacterium]|nr:methylmalonyl-CoA mutase family protein [Flavobacteriales bacterium]